MLLNMFTSPDESRFTNAENSSLMIVLFFQKLNKITLSAKWPPLQVRSAFHNVALLDLEFWCKCLQIRSLQNKWSADYVSLHPLLSITRPPLLLYQHVALWGHSDLDKVFSNPGRKELGVFYGPMTLDHSAAQHRPTGAWTGMGRAGLQGLEPSVGAVDLGTVPVGAKFWWHQLTA